MLLTINHRTHAVELAGAGPPLLLLHGYPLNHRMWRRQIAEFSRTHQVVAVDLAGFGESAAAGDVMRMEDYAADAVAVLDELGLTEPLTVCGLSMGGYIAFAFFRGFRDRLSRLILCDTRAIADTDEKREQRRASAEQALAEGTESLLETLIPPLLSHQPKPENVAETEALIRAASPAGIAAALRGMALRPDSTELLPRIDVPTLVICGEQDQISPPDEMRAIAQAIPGARFALIPHSGHLTPVENPTAVNQALGAFLR